jgi:hypothetical protein
MDLYAVQYEQLLLALASGRVSAEEIKSVSYLNELVPTPDQIQS